jgi:hypothetical protein
MSVLSQWPAALSQIIKHSWPAQSLSIKNLKPQVPVFCSASISFSNPRYKLYDHKTRTPSPQVSRAAEAKGRSRHLQQRASTLHLQRSPVSCSSRNRRGVTKHQPIPLLRIPCFISFCLRSPGDAAIASNIASVSGSDFGNPRCAIVGFAG